ncbi:MAG: pyruvate ferredoxin oxidoreductase [archaeon]
MSKTRALTGAHAVAEAMRQINPEVVPCYPITPQTPIVEKYAQFIADGIVDTEIIRVESEHSAMSATVGASAAGARAMTATSSAGLALMFEILGVASGLRLPIVMPVVNRALSAPINIHCDHSDTMGCRDQGWIQIYCENAQEAYDYTLLSLKLAEHPAVLLPAMVMQDGFITSHGVEGVDILDDKSAKKFIGSYNPKHSLLDFNKPVTYGPLQLQDSYFETKIQQAEAMGSALRVFQKICNELTKVTKRKYGYFEKYKLNDADCAIITMSSTAGTTKAAVDNLRKEGKKVGLLKINLYRPFPYKEVAAELKKLKTIAVLDRAYSYGADAPLFNDVKNSLFDLAKKPKMQSYVFGLGGRNISERDIEKVFKEILAGKTSDTIKLIGDKQ